MGTQISLLTTLLGAVVSIVWFSAIIWAMRRGQKRPITTSDKIVSLVLAVTGGVSSASQIYFALESGIFVMNGRTQTRAVSFLNEPGGFWAGVLFVYFVGLTFLAIGIAALLPARLREPGR